MKILYIAETLYVLNRGLIGNSWELDLIKFLANNTDSMLVFTTEWHRKRLKAIEFNPDIIILNDCGAISLRYFAVCINDCIKMGKPIIDMGDDLFHVKSVVNQPFINWISGFLLTANMKQLEQQYQRIFPSKITGGLDLYINTDIFTDYEHEKIYDILIYGTIDLAVSTFKDLMGDAQYDYFEDWKKRTGNTKIPDKFNFYPLRKYITDIVLKNKDKYRVKIISTPEKNCWDCPVRGKELSEEINKSFIAISTRSIGDRCMGKYGEISASGTFLLGNVPTDFPIFRENTIEVSEDMTEQEILDLIDSHLKDKKELARRSKEFGIKIRKLYGTTSTRVLDSLHEYLKKF